MDWERPQSDYAAEMRANLSRGLALASEHILSVADRSVPIEEGTLSRSGEAQTDGLSSVVFYSTEYAVYQHEGMDWNHDSGRSAKWLENALNSETQQALAIIARTVKGAQ